jgi:hypothetical protein
MSRELRPRWNGVVLLDEKMCPVRGKGQWLYLAVDTTGDIMHCRAVPELSSTEAAKFLEEVQALGVDLKGVVSDLDPALTRAVAVVYAEIPHQYCIKHALAAIGILIGYVERNARRSRSTLAEVDEEAGRWKDETGREESSRDRVLLTQQKQTCIGSAGDNAIAALYEVCRKILAGSHRGTSLGSLQDIAGGQKLPTEATPESREVSNAPLGTTDDASPNTRSAPNHQPG